MVKHIVVDSAVLQPFHDLLESKLPKRLRLLGEERKAQDGIN